MKKLILPLFLSSLCTTLQAQESASLQQPKTPVNELGIFGQTALGNDEHSVSMAGLQYKHWQNERLGFRIMGAVAQYAASGAQVQYISGDTVIRKQAQYGIGLRVLGVGIEAQRHFYKRVYLFAAVELSGGYGSGIADTSVSRIYGQGASASYFGENTGRRDADIFYAGITACIGAKIQWNRICIGTELTPVSATYRKLDNGMSNGGTVDMELGRFSERLFIHWRF